MQKRWVQSAKSNAGMRAKKSITPPHFGSVVSDPLPSAAALPKYWVIFCTVISHFHSEAGDIYGS